MMLNAAEFLSAFFSAALVVLSSIAAPDARAAAELSPVGLWKSFDDNTGLADAEVSITQANGQLTGRLLRDLITLASEPPLRCDKCTDERKGQPVVGMEIIRRAVYLADKNLWGNGEILDPEIGKTYRVEIKLLDGGKKIHVRGYWGPVYRTQIWERLQ